MTNKIKNLTTKKLTSIEFLEYEDFGQLRKSWESLWNTYENLGSRTKKRKLFALRDTRQDASVLGAYRLAGLEMESLMI